MKKIILVFVFIFAVLGLTSCKSDKGNFSLTLGEVTELRNKVVVAYTLTDEESQLDNSEVTYSISKKGSEDVEKSGTVSKTDSELTISSLTEATTYVLTITTTYKNKKVTLVEGKEFSTSSLGTSLENPYIINDASLLRTMLVNDNVGYFKLGADLDLSEIEFEPFFTSSSSYFKGHFDGDGHTISNFHLGRPAQEATETEEAVSAKKYSYTTSSAYLGLFGAIAEEGTVTNVNFDNVDLYVGRDSSSYFAVVAGYNAGTISNVNVTNSKLHVVTTSANKQYVGVIAGKNLVNGLIENCNVSNTEVLVESRHYTMVGGICAVNDAKETATKQQNKIVNVKFEGSIEVKHSSESSTSSVVYVLVGGIIGQNNSYINNAEVDATIKVSSALPNYAGSSYVVSVGGVAGQNLLDGSSVINAPVVKVSLDVESKYAKEMNVGFLVGQNGGSKDSSKALVLAATLSNKAESTVTGLLGKVNVGVIGLDKSNETTFNALDEMTLKLNEYKALADEETAQEITYKVLGTEVTETKTKEYQEPVSQEEGDAE